MAKIELKNEVSKDKFKNKIKSEKGKSNPTNKDIHSLLISIAEMIEKKGV